MAKSSPHRSQTIRPALWLVAFAVLASLGLAVYSLGDAVATDEDDETATGQSLWDSLLGADDAEEGSSDPRRGGPPPGWAAGSGGSRALGYDGDDPQVRASMRSHGPVDGGVRPEFRPAHHSGILTSVSGDVAVGVGESCDVRVLPVRSRQFNCLVRVTCGGVVLYPDEAQRAGYVPCSLEEGEPVRAVDDGFTHADGDPTVELDLVARTVRISDDAPNGEHFEAEVILHTSASRRM